jgi:hypothetical protein
MTENFKYFTIGLPADHGQPLYGIYQPILDCFLVVHHDLESINRVKALLTSRYGVFVVCVSAAENYSPTLIDNHVCHRWTLSNSMDVDLTNYLKNTGIINVQHLIETTANIDWDVDQERRWALMCLFYVTMSKKYKTGLRHGEIDHILGEFIELDDLEYTKNRALKEIFKILYFTRNETQAENKITSVINQFEVLEMAFNDHLEKYQ